MSNTLKILNILAVDYKFEAINVVGSSLKVNQSIVNSVSLLDGTYNHKGMDIYLPLDSPPKNARTVVIVDCGYKLKGQPLINTVNVWPDENPLAHKLIGGM